MTSSLSVPATVPVIYRGDDAVPSSSVTANELEWAFHRCPISDAVTEATLSLHYGATDAASMIVLFAGDKAAFLPLLLWGGVGTRFQQFAAFLEDCGSKFVQQVATASANPVLRVELLRSAFLGFANHLGRVTTYRALSLTEDAYQRIWDADEIFPTGQLTQTADTLTQIVAAHGIRKVVVARLYIAHLRRLIGYDPSISLHDDWQTTTVIASGYLARRGDEGAVEQRKDLYLFQVSVPVIESLGWTLARVAKEAPDFLGPRYAGHEPWFKFEAPAVPTGVWFDATIQRTERYGLYTVPHLRARIQRVWKFSALEDIAEAVAPFAAAQEVLHSQHPLGANPA